MTAHPEGYFVFPNGRTVPESQIEDYIDNIPWFQFFKSMYNDSLSEFVESLPDYIWEDIITNYRDTMLQEIENDADFGAEFLGAKYVGPEENRTRTVSSSAKKKAMAKRRMRR